MLVNDAGQNKTKKIKLAIWILLTLTYICIEPFLSQIVVIYCYNILYIPYTIIKEVFPILIIAFFIIFTIKRKSEVHFGVIIYIAIAYIIYLLASIVNRTDISIWETIVVSAFAECIIIMPICVNKDNLKLFIKICTVLYTILATVNIIFKISPNLYDIVCGYQVETFLTGWDNMTGFPLMMGLFFALLNRYYNNGKINLVIYVIIYIINQYLMWSATALVSATILLMFVILPIKKICGKCNFIVYIACILIVFILLVFIWGNLSEIEPLKFFVETVLKKDMTLTGRVEIWSGVWNLIKEKLLLGHGLTENTAMYYDTGYNWNWVHAHNLFLQTWYEGGILTLLACFAVLIMTAFKMNKCQNAELMGIFKITIFAMLVNYQADQFIVHPWLSGCWAGIFFICNFAAVVAENDS